MKITKVVAREIYDSRGWPTVECDVVLDSGITATASVATGLTRGRHEAYDLRDGGKRLWGMGVKRAVENIEQVLGPALIGKEPHGPSLDILMLDLDGTPDKSNIGANSMLAVSMALYKAHALSENIELYELIAYLCGAQTITMPFPQFNLINGGLTVENALNIQECLLLPVGVPDFRSSMELGVTVFHELKNVLNKHGKSTSIGDEGGFAAHMMTALDGLQYLNETIERVNELDGNRCVMAIDCAASRWFDRSSGLYNWLGKHITTEELIDVYRELIVQYPIYSLEDPLAEDDWEGWKKITRELGDKVQIVGDDIFATNFYRIEQGIKDQVATAVVIKPNQIGTITETLQVVQLCRQNELNTIISHRSGDTSETFIADLAVGTSAGQIKAGGCCRGERITKYNRLLVIEDALRAAQGAAVTDPLVGSD